jgi:hypothetical protein
MAAASDMRRALLLLGLLAFSTPAAAQSASEVERCFQNPANCPSGGAGGGGGGGAAAPRPAAPVAARPAPAPDYASILQSPDPDRRKLQESLRTLDKYAGPIDGDLQSEATVKAIGDWQKGHGFGVVGKLTPEQAQQLNAEASRAPIKRIDPSAQASATPALAPPSNAEMLRALQARRAERRKAAEPKAEGLAQALARDLKAYVASDGKTGPVGEQFPPFAKAYRENRDANRMPGDVSTSVEDYGDATGGQAVMVEVKIDLKEGEKTYPQCMEFAWVTNGTPARNRSQAFSCDDVAGLEKWKTDQALKTAWR